MARIPLLVKDADLPVVHRHYFDRIVRTRGRVAGPYQVLLHSPAIADRVAAVGEFLLYDTVLRPAIKTLTWLIAAREYDCDYEWAACVGPARKAGIPEALIEAIWSRKELKDLTQEQATLVDFCHQLLHGNHRVNPASYRAAVEQFGVAATVQIAATIGYFVMMAFVLNAFEVDRAEESGMPL